MKTTELTDLALVKSLRCTTCPACGNAKITGRTFCLRDYKRLPKAMRERLYLRLGVGYREAVIAALEFLDVHEPHLPPERAARRIVSPPGLFRE